MTSAPSRYRLKGEVDGCSRAFLLTPGANAVGNDTSCGVHLPEPGVSRRHAVLFLDRGGLRVADQDSKNGTFVNGVRVLDARLVPGDELWFGPIKLRLEEVDAEDTELVLVLDGDEESTAPARLQEPTTTTTYLRLAGSEPWLRLLLSLLDTLRAPPQGNLTAALELLRRHLGAEGVCLAELGDGRRATVLASCGELGELSGPAAEGFPRTTSDLPLAEGTRLRLVVWGDFEDRRHSGLPLTILLRLLDRFRHRPLEPPARTGEAAAEAARLAFPPGIVRGISPAIAAIYSQLGPLVRASLPVLLTGETGVGKEHLVRILHDSGERRSRPLVAVNCAAIPAELLEAELFGIGKNVATGVAPRPGKFLEADGGTLFLDEIGDMPLALQSKLLRALQEKEIHPLGLAPREVDVRIVAATNVEVEELLAGDRFRRDLYYRLAGYVLRVPPLRERREDVPLLVEHFLRRFTEDTGKRVAGVTVKAMRALVSYPWPGNVRECEHEVRRLVYLTGDGEAVESSFLSEAVLRCADAETSEPAADYPPADSGDSTRAADEELRDLDLETLERRAVAEALRRSGGNKARAARLLGISRPALGRRIERLGLGEPA